MSDSSSTTARVRPASPAAGSDSRSPTTCTGTFTSPCRASNRARRRRSRPRRARRRRRRATARGRAGEVEAAVAQVGVNEVAYREAVGGGRGLEEALEADGVGVGGEGDPRGRPETAGERSRPARARSVARADGRSRWSRGTAGGRRRRRGPRRRAGAPSVAYPSTGSAGVRGCGRRRTDRGLCGSASAPRWRVRVKGEWPERSV